MEKKNDTKSGPLEIDEPDKVNPMKQVKSASIPTKKTFSRSQAEKEESDTVESEHKAKSGE